jgi:hypothetical protein
MARKVVFETQYTFNPATKTIVFNHYIPAERLILITNVTKNIVIYNFSDPSLKGTVSASVNSNMDELTTVVLNYNTAAMSSTDKISILVDEYDEKFTPSESYVDSTNKLRVTTPQALIDTDFEYGPQTTKWENLGLINQRPFSYTTPAPIPNVSAITMNTNSRVVTVTLSSGTAPANGTSISVYDTYLSIANGNFTVESGGGTSTFTYTGRAVNSSGVSSILDTNKTVIYSGLVYTGAAIGGAPTMSYAGQAVSVTTTVPHGLSIGNEVSIIGATATTNAPNGTFPVCTITSPTQFTYYTLAAPTGTLSGAAATVYMVPKSQFLHRPFDGGVVFSANANSNNEQAIRQTRRYFRYQSGKGMQMSSGTILKPNLQLDSINSVGQTVTVQTKDQHNLQPGAIVRIGGCLDPIYNGDYAVSSIIGYNKFQYTIPSVPTSSVGQGPYYAAVISWYGCSNKLGIFDEQNGLFFEFNGQTLYAVRRNSTFQISGRVTATNGSNTITQTDSSFPTYFARQLNVGNFIVVRGVSYKVQSIESDTSMTITPSYRGSTTQFAIVSKTVDTKIPQSQWNIDKMDGTGPSGMLLDLAKMQMFYIDYSWYGAGYVRWGMRGRDGNVTYVHKMPNNNINNEAYMRSGNLPARYESSTDPIYTSLTSSMSNTDTAMYVNDTSNFPASGTLCVRDGSKYEYINYSAKTTTSFTGLTRAQSGSTGGVTVSITSGTNTGTVASVSGIQVGQRVISADFPDGTYVAAISGTTLTFTQASTATNPTGVLFAPMGMASPQSFTISATSPTMVELAFPSYSSQISHWGTSVIMDGRYDDDKSLVFTYGQTAFTTIASGASRALFSIRVAPSVDNGIAANFGTRELVNRMQLVLRALDVSTKSASANMLVTAVLNGTPSSATAWTNAINNATGLANSSLAQIANYAAGSTTISGGEVTGGFFVTGTTSVDLERVRDLGNSILGGGGTNANTNIYPDGPDVLTIVVTNTGAAAVDVLGRLSWTEAQA